jgi:hypothetical protein
VYAATALLNEVLLIERVAPFAIVPLPVPLVIVTTVPAVLHTTLVGHDSVVISAGTVNLTCQAVTEVTPLFLTINGVSRYV